MGSHSACSAAFCQSRGVKITSVLYIGGVDCDLAQHQYDNVIIGLNYYTVDLEKKPFKTLPHNLDVPDIIAKICAQFKYPWVGNYKLEWVLPVLRRLLAS